MVVFIEKLSYHPVAGWRTSREREKHMIEARKMTVTIACNPFWFHVLGTLLKGKDLK
jgi:hypothetical protein